MIMTVMTLSNLSGVPDSLVPWAVNEPSSTSVVSALNGRHGHMRHDD